MGKELVDAFYNAVVEMPLLFTDEYEGQNYDGFIQNRHNQSVLSVLTKKMGVKASRDVTEYGIHPDLYQHYNIPSYTFKFRKYSTCYYPQILIQHRRGTVTLFVKIYGMIRSYCPGKIGGKLINLAQIKNKIRRNKK